MHHRKKESRLNIPFTSFLIQEQYNDVMDCNLPRANMGLSDVTGELEGKVKIAEVYIERSAVITKGEKGSEMWLKIFGF